MWLAQNWIHLTLINQSQVTLKTVQLHFPDRLIVAAWLIYFHVYSRGQWWNVTKNDLFKYYTKWLWRLVLYSPVSITVLADRLQVVHGLPLIEAEAVWLDVLVVVLGPLQAVTWDHRCLDRPLAAAMQHLQHWPFSGGKWWTEGHVYLRTLKISERVYKVH